MSLDITKSVTLNGKSLEGTTSQGNMSASITKGQSLNINIYMNDPENLDLSSARTDVIQFISQVFANAMQVAPATKPATPTSGSNTSSSTSSSADKGTTPTKDTSSDSSSKDKETTAATTASTAGK